MVVTAIGAAVALFMTVLAPSPASGHDPITGQDPAAQDPNGIDDGAGTIPDIVFPVVGPNTYTDTWGACRGTGCSRSHKGVDIFSDRLTPMVAAADGVITSERRSGLTISGNTVIIQDDNGWRYIYIHLNNDTPGTDDGANPQGWIIPNGLRLGDRVEAGDVIGYLGDSGNAETTPPHVHFEIHQPGVGAINPTPIVAAAEAAGRIVPISDLTSTPEGRAEYGPVVSAWYRALLDREPTEDELFAWTDRFDIGFATTDELVADLTMAKERRDPAGVIIRSFAITLGRWPSLNELRLWEEQYRSGSTIEEITAVLIDSGPFVSANGELTNEEFISLLYRNAVGTEPTADRMEDWLEAFADGEPRETLAAYLADTYTVKDSTWHELEVFQAFRASLDRLPTSDELDFWVAHLDDGGLIPDVVTGIRAEPEEEEDTDDDAVDDSSEEPAPDADAGSDSDPESNEDASADTESETEPEPETETDSTDEANTDTDSEIDAESDTDSAIAGATASTSGGEDVIETGEDTIEETDGDGQLVVGQAAYLDSP